MTEDREDLLERLLRQADTAAGVPAPGPADLADRVRHQARRRRVTRITTSAAAAAVLALAVGSGLFMSRAKPDQPPRPTEGMIAGGDQSQSEVARLRAEIDRLRADLDETLALTRSLVALQRQHHEMARLRHELAQPDPIDQVHEEVEKAAFVMVYQADRMYRELHLPESAIESYRRAIELFPETRSAGVARQRLAEIEKPKGEEL